MFALLDDIVHLHHAFATTIDVSSILLNLVLLYLITNHSTLHMKPYKPILLLTCLGDMTLSFIVLAGQPVSVFQLRAFESSNEDPHPH